MISTVNDMKYNIQLRTFTKVEIFISLSFTFMNANEHTLLSNIIIKFSNMLIGCISDNTINQRNKKKLQYNQGILLRVGVFLNQNENNKKKKMMTD